MERAIMPDNRRRNVKTAIVAMLSLISISAASAQDVQPRLGEIKAQYEARINSNTPPKEQEKAKNQAVGCKLLMQAVAADLADWKAAECKDMAFVRDMVRGKTPLDCVIAAGILRNRNFHLSDLTELSNNTQLLLAKPCIMLVEGVDEQIADKFVERLRPLQRN
jgi:hypothetical protein